MSKKSHKFEHLINKEKYQVFVFSCKAYFPFLFAGHPWVVINKRGIVSRYEVLHFIDSDKTETNYIYINKFEPFIAINDKLFKEVVHDKINLLGYIEGEEGSLAKEVIEYVEDSPNNYPYSDIYNFYGPNSNTYVQNILNRFPELKIKLNWNHIGKEFNNPKTLNF